MELALQNLDICHASIGSFQAVMRVCIAFMPITRRYCVQRSADLKIANNNYNYYKYTITCVVKKRMRVTRRSIESAPLCLAKREQAWLKAVSEVVTRPG